MEQSRYSQGPRVRVAAVIIRHDSVLLVEHLKEGRHYFLLPGGGVDQGETLQEALLRELREEVRIEATPGSLLFACESIAPDRSRHIIQLAFAADIPSNTDPVLGEDPRVVDVRFASAEEVLSLPMFPRINQVLHAGLKKGFAVAPPFLGNLWEPQHSL